VSELPDPPNLSPVAEPAIRVTDLGHRFDQKWVLREITLDIAPGEIVTVLGGSGGGKTTFLRCVGGLLNPTEGDITIMGDSLRRNPDRLRSHTGFVFQYSALFDSMTVEENVLFGIRRQRKLRDKEGKELATQLLADVGLHDVLHRLPSELSGGMRKRVGLARALAIEPQVLLFDEPTSGLDPVTAYTIDRLITETLDRTGATSLVVTHDVGSVARFADRVLFFAQGEVAFWGSASEFQVSDDPQVRAFLEPGRYVPVVESQA
jgi:phospholipid/cholesterol/gamma-HCH transport system ATP-binding protein